MRNDWEFWEEQRENFVKLWPKNELVIGRGAKELIDLDSAVVGQRDVFTWSRDGAPLHGGLLWTRAGLQLPNGADAAQLCQHVQLHSSSQPHPVNSDHSFYQEQVWKFILLNDWHEEFSPVLPSESCARRWLTSWLITPVFIGTVLKFRSVSSCVCSSSLPGYLIRGLTTNPIISSSKLSFQSWSS